MVSRIIEFVSGVGAWAYALEAVSIFAEDALFFGFVFPAELLLVLCAFMAQQHALNVFIVFGIAAVFAIAGDQAGFEMGKHFGEQVKNSRLGRRISPESWELANELLSHRGGFAVFLGRWVAVLRALVPTTSGLVGIRWSQFTFWNAIGGISWAAAWTAVGYVAGASWEHAAKQFGEVAAAVAIVMIAAMVVSWRRFGRARRAERRKAAGR